MGVKLNPFTSQLDVVDSPSGDFSTVSLDQGTAGSPSIAFDSDPDTGIYSPNANEIAFSNGGFTRLVVDSGGRLLIGTSSYIFTKANGLSAAPAITNAGTSTSPTSIATYYFNNNASGAGSVVLSKSRSTTIGEHVSVINNDRIGSISYSASDGTAFVEAARISAEVDGTPAADDLPGRLVFLTTASGASSPTERMRIKESGIVNIANAPTYADNTAALAGGLVAGDIYRKSDGTLMITY